MRITIKVLLEARPGMTRQQLVAFFHVSTRTVTDAARHSLAHWASELVVAPEPANFGRSRFSPSRKPAMAMAKRRGSRAQAKLIEPEATVKYKEQVDFDEPEPVIDDEAMERAITEADDRQDQMLRGVKNKDK